MRRRLLGMLLSVRAETGMILSLKFTGKDLDEDTGLYYFNARWYDSNTGRFISEDPARDGSNWYIYTVNNPLRFTDPTGMTHTDDYYKGMEDAMRKQSKVAENNQSGNNNSGSKDHGSGNNGPDKPDKPDDTDPEDPTNLEDPLNNTPTTTVTLPENVPESALIQIVIGIRGAVVVGGEVAIGIVVNPNNLSDSGILLKGAVGTGMEVGVDTPLNDALETALSSASNSLDLTHPTSTQDIEGPYTKATVSLVGGIESDLETNEITGVTVGTVGGGVYTGATTVVTIDDTIGRLSETVVNQYQNMIRNRTRLH